MPSGRKIQFYTARRTSVQDSYSRWCHIESTSRHSLQTKHIWFLCLRHRSKGNDDRWKLLSIRRSFGSSGRYLPRSRLHSEMHRLLEGESQIISNHLWRSRSTFGNFIAHFVLTWPPAANQFFFCNLQKYRCWVYQRADLNRVLISQAVGAFCHIKQDVTSWNYTEGAVVALDMTEYERERKSKRYSSNFSVADSPHYFPTI